MQQRFDTKAQRMIKRRQNIAFFSVCFAVLVACVGLFVGLGRNMPLADPQIAKMPEYTKFMVLFAIAGVEVYLLFFLPACAVYFGKQAGKYKGYREDATFSSPREIMYYRDALDGVSPATISILMDLRLEDNKDISATLLRLYNKKAINFNNGSIVATGSDIPLDAGERELMEMVRNRSITPAGVTQWKNNRKNEAFYEGYVQKPDAKKAQKGCNKGCGTGCLTIVILAICMAVVSFFVAPGDGLMATFDATIDAMKIYGLRQTDFPVVLEVTMRYALMGAIFDFMIFLPCYMLYRTTAYHAEKQGFVLERTPKGEELAGKIAGLKRFIHDFTLLPEAQKEKVVLWNDFLVYAVVLEENEQIVEDISKRYKIDIGNFKNPF